MAESNDDDFLSNGDVLHQYNDTVMRSIKSGAKNFSMLSNTLSETLGKVAFSFETLKKSYHSRLKDMKENSSTASRNTILASRAEVSALIKELQANTEAAKAALIDKHRDELAGAHNETARARSMINDILCGEQVLDITGSELLQKRDETVRRRERESMDLELIQTQTQAATVLEERTVSLQKKIEILKRQAAEKLESAQNVFAADLHAQAEKEKVLRQELTVEKAQLQNEVEKLKETIAAISVKITAERRLIDSQREIDRGRSERDIQDARSDAMKGKLTVRNPLPLAAR